MLLDGSYLRDVETIMDALKITRRGLIREGVLQVIHIWQPLRYCNRFIQFGCHLSIRS